VNTRTTSNNDFRIIPTKVHGIIDYLSGLALLAAPNIFGFDQVGGPAVWVPRILGVAILLMALLTRYELGVVKLIPMPLHLMIDVVASIFLAASPFIFRFADNPQNVWVPHVAVGIVYLIITVLTQTEPHIDREPLRGNY
jgi:hypothetical protein